MADVNNREDILDSRDVIARIEELRGVLRFDEIEDARTAVTDARLVLIELPGDANEMVTRDARAEMTAAEAELAEILAASEGDEHEAEREELAALEAFAKEGEDYAQDWIHGATLIRESYFTAYAEELAADIGAINPDASWPLTCIDWDKAADELKADYTEVDFDGVAYFIS